MVPASADWVRMSSALTVGSSLSPLFYTVSFILPRPSPTRSPPALVIQNNLQYVAASNLDAATFQVTYQIKILTTAAFSVVLLRRKLSSQQWFALLCLTIGVGIVQIQAHQARPVRFETLHVHTMNPFRGLAAVTIACVTSGLAGVYFEMVLKNSQADVWVRNVQLSLFSLLPALAPVIFSAHDAPGDSGLHPSLSSLFHNFGFWAWATVAIQVFGGLITALVIKYSDNILKGFATSLSIVISFLASVALFHFSFSFIFVLGSLIVLIATWLYNHPLKRLAIFENAESLAWNTTQTSVDLNRSASPSEFLKRITSSAGSFCSLSSILSSPPLSEDKTSSIR